jgi:glycosyltransferase involved in cell wall biosynthesis
MSGTSVSSEKSATRTISLVIPCYNESGNAEVLISRAIEATKAAEQLDIIFVDNGSKDDTYEKLEALIAGKERLKLVQVEKNVGYGHGIKHGLKFSTGEVVGWTHADMQTDPFDAVRAIEGFPPRSKLFISKGARFGRPISDRIFTFGMSVFESLLFRQRLRDINAQPTLFSREILDVVLEGPDDFSLDLFTLIVANKKGLTEYRFPVKFGPRFSGESKWNTSQSARIRFIRRTISFSLSLAKRRWPDADRPAQGK